MFSRICSLVVLLALSSGSHIWAKNIFVTSDDGTSSFVSAYTGDASFSGPSGVASAPGAFAVFSTPLGTKYYIVARSGALSTVVIANQSFQEVKRISITGEAASALMTPDGRKLVVAAGTVLHIVDTETDTSTPVSVADVGTFVRNHGLAASLDSRRVFVVGSTGIAAVDPVTNVSLGSKVNVGGAANAVAVGPNGYVYTSTNSTVTEYDPANLTSRRSFYLFGQPGKPVFTPDGRYALVPNLNGSNATVHIWRLDLAVGDFASHTAPGVAGAITKLALVSNSKAFGLSAASGVIYEINIVPLSLQAASFPGAGTISAVRDIAVSEEAPSATYLYVSSPEGLSSIAAGTNQLLGRRSIGNPPGPISVAGVSAGSGVAQILQYNTTQAIAAGAISGPLVVRAVDASGKPVYDAFVIFAPASGVTLTSTTARTNADGFATSTATVSSFFGSSFSVNATVNGSPAPLPFVLVAGTGGGTGSSQQIVVVSGSGQVVQVPTGNTSAQSRMPLKVRVQDSLGQPLVGATVYWTVQGPGAVDFNATVTDWNGESQLFFHAIPVTSTAVQSVVAASTLTGSVAYFAMNTLPPDGTFVAELIQPTDGQLNLRAGETLNAGIQARALMTGTTTGVIPLSNVGLRVAVVNDSSTLPSATCSQGTSLSDSAGVATCTVTAGPRIGSNSLTVYVGEQFEFQVALNVRAGAPAQMRIVQGNNQSGRPGQQLPVSLLAEVSDVGGNPVPGATVQWEVSPAGGATLSQARNNTDINGRTSAFATLGNTPGAVTVRAVSGSQSVSFTLNVNVALSGIQAVSGGGQTAITGQAFAQPLVVEVRDSSNQPVPNITVNFAVSSGSASIGSASAVTNAQGRASTAVTAGATAGEVVVTASATGVNPVTFRLTVSPPGPVFNVQNITNAASGQPGVSPGALVTIYAQGVASGLNGSVVAPTLGLAAPLPTRLRNVEVLFGGVAAPILAVSNIDGMEQVTVQAPFELTPGQTSVAINVGSGSRTVQGVQVSAYQPGVFESALVGSRRFAVVLRPDGSVVSSANPAQRGEICRALVTGLGPVSPNSGTGRAGIGGQLATAQVVVGVNHAGVRVISAEYAENLVGVFVVSFEIPADTATGADRPFAVAVVGPDGQLIFGNGSALPAIQ